jgi:formylglycine-generating enzyme required for sulfatase activity
MGVGKQAGVATGVDGTLTGSLIAAVVASPVPPASIAEGSGDDIEEAAATPSASPSVAGVPEAFDGYLLVRALGRGAMGEVYLAKDTVLDRPVAVKLIASLEPGPIARERFLREARAIARLQHPNVVAVYRAGEVAGLPYLVSELVRGGSLDQLPLPFVDAQLLHVCTGLASGLAAAHRRGVLHRDLKPANALMSDDGEVKLCDFGLAKLVGVADTSNALSAVSATDGSAGGGGDLTRAGALVGTPRYMAPEQWRSEPATMRSDLYSLGAMFYKLSSGVSATAGENMEELRHSVLSGAVRSLPEIVPGLDPAFCAIVHRCLSVDPAERPASADDVLAELVALATPAAKVPAGNPYRGLRAFDAEHRALFFGRRADSLTVLERLRSDSLVVVAGDSGVGKSSLCRAGVVPLVIDGALHEERAWTAVRLVPGRHPLAELLRALAPFVEGGETGLASQLASDPRAASRRLCAGLGSARGLLLMVDQLEELVTEADVDERDVAALVLAELSSHIPGVKMLATARGDFLTRLAALPGFGHEMSRALYLLGPLDRTQLREAVTGPARASSLRFESEAMVETLVAAAAAAPAALPLLQFALAELWDRRDSSRSVIPSAALDAIGGVDGALARHADGVLATMAPTERKRARRLLTQLVTVEGTRAYRGEAELVGDDEVARAALRALVRGRLLAVHADDDGQSIYEVAHEALLSGWTTLRAWLDGDAERRAVHQRLAASAAEWERLAGARSVLWGAPQLAEAARVDLSASIAGGRERRFIDASLREERRRTWRTRAMIVAAPLLVAALWGGLALKTKLDRDHAVAVQMALATPQLASWEGARAAALANRGVAFALFDLSQSEAAERVWTTARKMDEVAESSFQRALGPLETMLRIDTANGILRNAFAGFIFERAELAEAFMDRGRVEESISRLGRTDETGDWLRRWNAPATLHLDSDVAGAPVRVMRYEDRAGKLVAGPALVASGTTPFEIELAPDSYIAIIDRLGGTPILYPIRLVRGEDFEASVSIELNMPIGFVYIPPGRFLYGNSDEDELRRDLFVSEPEHAAYLSAFGIGRHEVTWNEWIAFLDSQPPNRRLELLPSADGIRLEFDESARPILRFQPSSREYTFEYGKPIVYEGRTSNKVEDWSRFPVTGITSSQAMAYTNWLHSTGRVKGARLCTDREWERAARGADERLFPTGNVILPEDANFDETYGRNPDAFGLDEVGTHPGSDSPFGVSDLAGNAWEYVTSTNRASRVNIRSGGFYDQRTALRSNNRGLTEPELHSKDIGFRVCCDL